MLCWLKGKNMSESLSIGLFPSLIETKLFQTPFLSEHEAEEHRQEHQDVFRSSVKMQ